MSKVTIQSQKLIYSKDINKVTNSTFNTLVPPVIPSTLPVEAIPTVDEFFNNYETLFYQIPQTGNNSHETLIQQSCEYVGLNLQQLLDQINFLQEQNKQLQQQINEFNTNI